MKFISVEHFLITLLYKNAKDQGLYNAVKYTNQEKTNTLPTSYRMHQEIMHLLHSSPRG